MVETGLAADLSALHENSVGGIGIGALHITHGSLAADLAPLMETMVSAPDQIMLAIGPLRSFTRALDRMMVAANDLVETAEVSGYDRIKIANAIRGWNAQLGGVYGDFAKSRSRMYTAAKAVRIPTRRFSKSRPKKSMKGMALPALATSADRIAQRLVGDIKKTGNQAAFLLKNLDRLEKKWVKRPPNQDTDTFRNDAGAVIGEFLILRDMVGGSIFAAMNGIVKRIDAMTKLGGVDKWGNPPRPVRVPTPAEVADRIARTGAGTRRRTREVVKVVKQEAPPKQKPEPKPKPMAQPHPGYDPRYPKGWTPGKDSSKKYPTFVWKGEEYLLTRVMPRVMLAKMPEEMRDAHAQWASPAGQKAANRAWAQMEGVMKSGMSEIDSLFEEIVTLEHARAAGEYALDNGRTVRPVHRSVEFLQDMGLQESSGDKREVEIYDYVSLSNPEDKKRIERDKKAGRYVVVTSDKKTELFRAKSMKKVTAWLAQNGYSQTQRQMRLGVWALNESRLQESSGGGDPVSEVKEINSGLLSRLKRTAKGASVRIEKAERGDRAGLIHLHYIATPKKGSRLDDGKPVKILVSVSWEEGLGYRGHADINYSRGFADFPYNKNLSRFLDVASRRIARMLAGEGRVVKESRIFVQNRLA